MADFDEELKRQAAISSLLERDDSGDSYAASMAPEVIKPDTQEEYHKLINQAFPSVAEDQPEGLPKAPTIAEDQPQGPPKLAPTPIVSGLLTDPESGSRYVKDPTVDSGVVPYAEPATRADEEAFKPGDVALPQSTVLGPAPRAKLIDPDPDQNYFELNQADQPTPGFVEGSQNAIVNPAAGVIPPKPDLSKTTGFAVADPDPNNPDYKTPLSSSDELKFQAWVKKNHVPFDDSASSDYDMRGFWKAAQEGDPRASTAVSKFDGKLHFDDFWKTPFHKTFSNESQYATSDAPHWVGDRLIDNQGNVVADETPPAKKGKPVPGFVESSQNAIVNPAAGVIKPDPTQGNFGDEELARSILAPDKPALRAQPAAPKAEIVQDPIVTRSIATNIAAQSAPAPAAPAPTSDQVIQPASDDDYNKLINSSFPSAQTKAEVGDGDMPPMLNAPNGQPPSALVVHHTGGRNSPASVVEDWRTNRPGVGAQMIMDRDGTIHYTQKEFGYNGTGNFLHSVIPGVSNQTAVGIEVIAKDDADMTPAQLQSLQQLAGPKGPYANVPVYGHSQVSPGDRDNEGVRGVNAINEARSGAAPTGEPGSTPIETLVKLDQSGLNVTHFGYEKPGEDGYDKDSANGNGKYVKNLIPGYDVALNSAGAAMVGNPKPGETFTFAGKEFRYGDAVSEKLTDPRFDIFDPSGTALTGSMPVGRQVAASAHAKNKMPWDDWPKLSPADQAAAEKEGQDFRTQQVSALDKLNQATKSPKQFWEMLQKPIEGVTDSQRQAYAENWKQKATQSAVDFYSQKGTLAEQHVTPEDAFKKAMSDPGWEEYVGNVGRGLAGAVGEADIGIALAGKSIDRNRADGFMNLVHPDSTGEGRAAFLKNLTDIHDKFEGHRLDDPGRRQRHELFNQIYGDLPQETKDAIGDPASILDSIDNLANPAEQADLNKRIATKKAWVDQQLAGSPELRGTGADWWTTGTGENLFNTVAALVPGGVGAVVRTSTLGAQMYSSNMDRIAKEHPDYSPEQVSEEASKSAFMTLAPQEAVLAASHGLTAPLLKWAGSLAEKPIVRFGIGGGVQVAAAGVGGALGQVGSNVAENKPLLTDVPQAAGSALVQSLPFAVHGGLGALGHEVAPVEHAAPVEPARAEPAPAEATPAEPAPAEPTPAEPVPPRPVTRGEMLGPDEPPPPQTPRPWYMQGAEPGQDPLVIRGNERTTWTPQELNDLVNRARGTPEGLKSAVDQMWAPRGVRLGDEGTLEAEQTAQIQARGGPSITLAQAIKKAKADAVAAKLGVPPVKTKTPGYRYPPLTSFESPSPAHTAVYNDLIAGGMREARAASFVERARGTTEADILADVQTQMRERASGAPSRPLPSEGPGGEVPPPRPGNINGEESWAQREADKSTIHAVAEELTKGVANKYAEERMKAGELDPIDPNTGLTTEELMARALKMRPQEVDQHINDFMENRGGDPRDHAAAVRRQENFLTDRNRALSLKADSNPHDVQAQREAAAARKALNDFYVKGGPISKMKEMFHVHGVGLQGEPSIDLSTSGGLHEKFTRETGKPPPPSAEPRLKKAAERVRITHSDEYKARDKVDKAIDKDGRKKIPSIEEVRDYVAKRMTQMPCRK